MRKNVIGTETEFPANYPQSPSELNKLYHFLVNNISSQTDFRPYNSQFTALAGRFYPDLYFLESTTPECSSAVEVVNNQACFERMLDIASSDKQLSDDQNKKVRFYSSVNDGYGNTVGYHVNIGVNRDNFELDNTSLISTNTPLQIMASWIVASHSWYGAGFYDFKSKKYGIYQKGQHLSRIANRRANISTDKPIFCIKPEEHYSKPQEEINGRLHITAIDKSNSHFLTRLFLDCTSALSAVISHGHTQGFQKFVNPIEVANHLGDGTDIFRKFQMIGPIKSISAIDFNKQIITNLLSQRYTDILRPNELQSLNDLAELLDRISPNSQLPECLEWHYKRECIEQLAANRSAGSSVDKFKQKFVYNMQWSQIGQRGLAARLRSGQVWGHDPKNLEALRIEQMKEGFGNLSLTSNPRAISRTNIIRELSQSEAPDLLQLSVNWNSIRYGDINSKYETELPMPSPFVLYSL